MPASLSALNRGRRAARADMRSTCRITRPGGQVWDPEVLQYVEGPPIVVYEGVCKLRRVGALQIRHAEAAGQLFIQKGSTLHLPATAAGVTKDDSGVILSSITDPQTVGVHFRIEAAEAYDNATSRRFNVEGAQ